MATSEDTSFRYVKPKVRFGFYVKPDAFTLIDHRGKAWRNGVPSAVPLGEYYTPEHRYGEPRKTLDEARADMPSSEFIDILPPDTLIVWVHVEHIAGKTSDHFVVMPDEATRIRNSLEGGANYLSAQVLDGSTISINCADIAHVSFRPDNGKVE